MTSNLNKNDLICLKKRSALTSFSSSPAQSMQLVDLVSAKSRQAMFSFVFSPFQAQRKARQACIRPAELTSLARLRGPVGPMKKP